LSQGAPFGSDLASKIFEAVGVPLSLEGLASVYDRVFADGSVVAVLLDKEEKETKNEDNQLSLAIGSSESMSWVGPMVRHYTILHYRIKFLTPEGKERGFVDIRFRPMNTSTAMGVLSGKRALDLHLEWVEILSEERGAGFGPRLLKASARFLQNLNDHPETRITLLAQNDEPKKLYGAYVWSSYGFDYIPRSASRMSWLRSTTKRFHTWLQEKYGAQLTISDKEAIAASVALWEHPWDVVGYNVSNDIHRSLGEWKGKIGQEYLRDPRLGGEWEGILFVNQPHSPGMQIFRKKVGLDE
jgi:hypothetical protein